MSTLRTTVIEEEDREADQIGDLHLLVMSPDSFATVPLPRTGTLTIGRSASCEVQIPDPLASREHARLHLEKEEVLVEDLGSANGTRVREAMLKKNERVALSPGEGITIGTTVLMAQRTRTHVGRQRLWSHANFDRRLEAECDRAVATGGVFAVVRLRILHPVSWTKLAPVFAREVPAPHVFAVYGPNEYELLVVERTTGEVERLCTGLCTGLETLGVSVRAGTAWFPRDGRTADALIAKANGLVAPRRTTANLPATAPATEVGPVMQQLEALASRAAASDIKVLILGENGVGKDVLARKVFQLSPRKDKPFIALNCGAFTESLIETELFGHEKGAFTGAVQAKPGLFEAADGGTVFLDEIGDLPLALQARLLHVLQTRQVRRVGGIKERTVDIRFIAATNRDLEADVAAKRFRQDLFYRINGITLAIPPLRERTTEIPGLARTFLTEMCLEGNRAVPVLGEEVLELLRGYSWPGNVRELRNVVQRALILCDGDEILPEHLPLDKMMAAALPQTSPPVAVAEAGLAPRHEPSQLTPAEVAEKERIVAALAEHLWNQTRAAKALEIPRRTFVYKMRRYNIPGSRGPQGP